MPPIPNSLSRASTLCLPCWQKLLQSRIKSASLSYTLPLRKTAEAPPVKAPAKRRGRPPKVKPTASVDDQTEQTPGVGSSAQNESKITGRTEAKRPRKRSVLDQVDVEMRPEQSVDSKLEEVFASVEDGIGQKDEETTGSEMEKVSAGVEDGIEPKHATIGSEKVSESVQDVKVGMKTTEQTASAGNVAQKNWSRKNEVTDAAKGEITTDQRADRRNETGEITDQRADRNKEAHIAKEEPGQRADPNDETDIAKEEPDQRADRNAETKIAKERADRNAETKIAKEEPDQRADRRNETDAKEEPDQSRGMLRPYSEAEWTELARTYSPAQLEVIRAGEEAIDLQDIQQQGALRTDAYGLRYVDDLAKVDPILDYRMSAEPTSEKPRPFRFKTRKEIEQEFAGFLKNAGENTTANDYRRFINQMHLTDDPRAKTHPESLLVQPIPRGIPSLEMAKSKREEEEVPEHMKLLMRQTGLSHQEIRSLRTKTLVRHRVVNQTRLGKIDSMYVLTVAGNGKGMLGVGEGKSSEIIDASRQAQYNAIRNMQPVLRYEQRTIFGAVRGKSGAVELELRHSSPGYGLRCQHLIFEMCRCAGIADISARVTRARNQMNVVKATFKALLKQRSPDEMARGLGRKLVDVRKVYYGGNVS